MESGNVFLVGFFEDETLTSYIDCIRLLADPSIRKQSHLTIRGPYPIETYKKIYKNPKHTELKDWEKIVKSEQIFCNGIGEFYSSTNATIFINCNKSSFLREVWKKPDYGEFTPHITLYNGDNIPFAHSLKSVLENYSFDFSISSYLGFLFSSQLSKSGYKNNDISLESISKILGRRVTFDYFLELTENERIEKVKNVCEKLKHYTAKESTEHNIITTIERLIKGMINHKNLVSKA